MNCGCNYCKYNCNCDCDCGYYYTRYVSRCCEGRSCGYNCYDEYNCCKPCNRCNCCW